MLSLHKIIIFSFHSLIFHSKIYKHPWTFFERGWGNSSLKPTYVEGEGGEEVHTYKMNRDRQGWGSRSKIRSFEWTYFLNDPKVFAATKIYMLIFNLIPILIAITYNGLPYELFWIFMKQPIYFSSKMRVEKSPEKNNNGIKKVLRKWKIMVTTWDQINTLIFWVHSLMLWTYIHRLEINIFRVFWSNVLWYVQNSHQLVRSIFPNGKCFSQYIDKSLKF